MFGVGLRHPHFKHVVENDTQIDWFEVHCENFFYKTPAYQYLSKIREKYPISLHGVGLSLGSADGIQMDHLQRLKNLIAQIDPFLISEHLSWSSVGGNFYPDLFPVPYNHETLTILKKNIDLTQSYLQRSILIENPSSYLEYNASTFTEVDFLITLAQQTGAKILLDVNNIFVSCANHGWNAQEYINAIPAELVGEIHIAGHSIKESHSLTLHIDSHDSPVCQGVWDLYAIAIQRFKKCPTLLEWDDNIPEFAILENEALKAVQYHA